MSYTDDELKEKRLRYLKDCKPKELRQLRKDGALADALDRRVARCRRRAEELMDSGTFEGQAWSWAVREVLLETEAD